MFRRAGADVIVLIRFLPDPGGVHILMGGKETLKPSKRYHLSKKQKKALANILEKVGVRDYDVVEKAEFRDGFSIIVVDGLPCLIEVGEGLYPHLLCLLKTKTASRFPRVLVDRGATLAVLRGAHLMVPGIRRIEGEFQEDEIVVVVDEATDSPIAVGVALMPSTMIREKLEGERSERRGRAIRIFHRVGDRYWEAGRIL